VRGREIASFVADAQAAVELLLRSHPFSISTGVGFIGSFGIAALNGVVLVRNIIEPRSDRRLEPRVRNRSAGSYAAHSGTASPAYSRR
jgi:Cu/Ag efflux pump CusA